VYRKYIKIAVGRNKKGKAMGVEISSEATTARGGTKSVNIEGLWGKNVWSKKKYVKYHTKTRRESTYSRQRFSG
jgi:hypothetical protein